MTTWFFATDLHGRVSRWRGLLETALRERPQAVLLGGDLLPHGLDRSWAGPADAGDDFVRGWLLPAVATWRRRCGPSAPELLLIPGNDDERRFEPALAEGEERGLWRWIHGRRLAVGDHEVLGYGCVPPTPFGLKDWERYDVSRSVDPGCVSPEEGVRTVAISAEEARWTTIAGELEAIAGDRPLDRTVCLFHSPPYDTCLDRAGLDGQMVDHVPVDLHVGSIAIRRFVEERQPLLALSGHVHEACRLTGDWRTRIGATWCLGGAHDGPELCLVRVDPATPAAATRTLVAAEPEVPCDG